MKSNINTSRLSFKELLFQIVLNIVVFVFFAFDKRLPGIESHQVFFYLNFAVAGIFINYFLLPRYLYKNKYWQFTIYTLIVVALVITIEEAFLEQIFYPETRAKRFLGIFYNLLSTLPTITILVGCKFAWDALNSQREVLELKNSVKESELQYLKSQINPHFLFNNINNLYAYAVENSPKTPELILELSSVLRYMLYECKAQFVPLKKEIEHLKNYINLSKLQIEGRGSVDIDIENVPEDYQIAPIILSVFIENAFKHSASSQTEDISINVKLNIDKNGKLIFLCSNTYHAQSNIDNLDSGIGLENVRKRLALIYPNSHKLDITTKNNLYQVELTIGLSKIQH
ncbi:histidine kinase [uncultured Winogradskyella sp.]|uniref:sensor histidine kinase n=1 Tax=uncultured Winogradskyella sp. TaxID=395353 RepID=UPI00261F6EC3|nr:histidine kinase [uncultured Winogradskyella sp.]